MKAEKTKDTLTYNPLTMQPWQQMVQLWANGLEATLEQTERLQSTLWEQSTRSLDQLRQQVDSNMKTFQSWAMAWQRQTSEHLRRMARFGNGG